VPVALSLQSIAPVTVRIETGTEDWDVKVSISQTRTADGSITITRESPAGGTFVSSLPVVPFFVFVRRNDSLVKTLDVGALPIPAEDLVSQYPIPWVSTPPSNILAVAGLNDNFYASAAYDGKAGSCERGPLAQHGIRPAQPRKSSSRSSSRSSSSSSSARSSSEP
jgi:hypothetical protein